MKKALAVAGLGFIIFAAVWKFLISPGLIERLPSGWSWEAHFVGTQTYADEKTGQLPEHNLTAIYLRKAHITDEKKRPASVSIEDSYSVITPSDKKIMWEYIFKAEVDPRTGRHLKKEWQDEIFVFPRFTEKKTYKFRNNYVKGVPLAYQNKEEIGRTKTYVFSYKGRGEYTESYEGTPEYPGIKVEQGQEIKCADDQFIFKIWVEPVSGTIVKLQESCLSGDYVYDIKTGKQLTPILRWGGITEGDDVQQKADEAWAERLRILWITRYLPLLTAVIGALLVWLGICKRCSDVLRL